MTDGEEEMIYILAGDNTQALNWARSHRLERDQFRVIMDPMSFRGAPNFDAEDVVRIGTWRHRRDIDRINDEILIRDRRVVHHCQVSNRVPLSTQKDAGYYPLYPSVFDMIDADPQPKKKARKKKNKKRSLTK